jgi:hypothetical protein
MRRVPLRTTRPLPLSKAREWKGRHHAHELIERLPDSQIAAAVRLLEFMLLDPVARTVATATPDDEPVTDQDRRRLHDSQARFGHRGKGIPMEDVLAEFGFKSEDFPLDK